MTTIDPRDLGARCDECVLKNKGVYTPSAMAMEAEIDVVTDYPRRAPKRPLIPAAEMALAEASGEARLNVLPAVACAPVKGSLEDVLDELAQENRRLLRAEMQPRPGPVECCRPRLLKELKAGVVLTLGPEAYRAVTGQAAEIGDIRGGPVEVGGLKVVPTVNAVQKWPVWRRIFKSDVQKALRWAREGLDWPEARRSVNPRWEALAKFLKRPGPFAIDVETTRGPVESCLLKCVGIATADAAVLVQYLSVEGPGGRLVEAGYTESERVKVDAILRAFFADDSIDKVAHNGVTFDGPVLRRYFGVEPKLLDTLVLHRVVDPEAPHSLGHVASVYTDAPSWKAEHAASDARSDEELARYCLTDCVVTARLVGPLVDEAQALGLGEVVAHDHEVQRLYRRMREVGLPVVGVAEEIKRLEVENRRLEWALKKHGVDPSGTAQLKRLLFEEWALVPRRLTAGGQPALDVAALRLLRRGLEGPKAEIIDLLLARARVRAAYRSLSDVHIEDGRVRPDWSVRADAWTPELGRFVQAPEGKVLVSGRLLQPRLRLATAEAGLEKYREVFGRDGDPHIETAVVMLGEAVRGLTGDKRNRVRRYAYDVLEASLYGAGDEAVFDAVTLLEEADGTLRYPSMKAREVAAMRRAWVESVPEVTGWWNAQGEAMRAAGAATEPVKGRRLPGGGGHEGLRWRVEQGAAALVQDALLAVDRAGLVVVALAKDAVLVEADADQVDRAVWLMEEAMGAEVGGVKLKAAISLGPQVSP